MEMTGIPCHSVYVEGAIRANVSVVEADGTLRQAQRASPILDHGPKSRA